jgi:hypothetical protein
MYFTHTVVVLCILKDISTHWVGRAIGTASEHRTILSRQLNSFNDSRSPVSCCKVILGSNARSKRAVVSSNFKQYSWQLCYVLIINGFPIHHSMDIALAD